MRAGIVEVKWVCVYILPMFTIAYNGDALVFVLIAKGTDRYFNLSCCFYLLVVLVFYIFGCLSTTKTTTNCFAGCDCSDEFLPHLSVRLFL